jgi:F-type H+-transporting ATPase subunit c
VKKMKAVRNFKLGLWVAALALMSAFSAFAQESEEAVSSGNAGWLAIAAAFGIGIAAFGGALGQGKAISAALDGIARNPGATSKIQMPMLIGLAFIESLVIYVLLIAFFIVFKL